MRRKSKPDVPEVTEDAAPEEIVIEEVQIPIVVEEAPAPVAAKNHDKILPRSASKYVPPLR